MAPTLVLELSAVAKSMARDVLSPEAWDDLPTSSTSRAKPTTETRASGMGLRGRCLRYLIAEPSPRRIRRQACPKRCDYYTPPLTIYTHVCVVVASSHCFSLDQYLRLRRRPVACDGYRSGAKRLRPG